MKTLIARLDGRKTRIAAGIAVLLAASELAAAMGLPALSPDQRDAVIALGVAFGLWGIGHKLDKQTAAVGGVIHRGGGRARE